METEIKPFSAITIRRIVLIIMTLIVGVIMGGALIASWQEPQVASRLELYQTDLLLKATAWDGGDLPKEQVILLRQNLLGEFPLQEAQKAYESVRANAVEALEKNKSVPAPQDTATPRLKTALEEQSKLLDRLDTRLGILAAEQGNIASAEEHWQTVKDRQAAKNELWYTADTLARLWQNEGVPVNSDMLLRENLQGWFLNRALEKFYRAVEETNALTQLKVAEVEAAENTVVTLALVGVLPAVGALAGAMVLTFLGIQRLIKGSESLLAKNRNTPWETPWTAETIWLVLVGGFFFMGQLLVPLALSPFRGVLVAQGIRGQALFALIYYLTMASGAIAVLFFSIRAYRPWPPDWFKFKFGGNWFAWGLGGYLAALPLMLTVSLLNQQIWQGQGGSNPLLQTVLEARDPGALGIFFFTAAIAAPLFEEFLFRGFLLPSLTRYMPVWGAIAFSGFIFAVAHLSLSEVLPLMVLGVILGIVYTRSRNLLAPMLLHSLWNSITMLGLFLLGSGVSQ